MVASIRHFSNSLFEEHLEEASFLYSQCRQLRAQDQLPWHRVEPFEERLELHLDALMVGADWALQVAQRRAMEGDEGELFAAVCLFCRHSRADLLARVLANPQGTNADRAVTLADALKYEMPSEWVQFVERALVRQDDRLLPMLSAACTYRRIPCHVPLSDALARLANPPLALVEAVGVLGAAAAEQSLRRLLSHMDHRLRSAALVALLYLRRHEVLQAQYLIAQKEAWPHIAMGLAGDRAALHALLLAPAGHDKLLALGLLGSPEAVRLLYECLDDELLAPTAARAMHWICGAELYAGVFQPEPVDEDELFPKELKAWRAYKDTPKAADGQPFGKVVRTLSTDKGAWKDWLSHHFRAFDPQLRYRMGKPCTPEVLVDALAAPDADPLLRSLTARELALRYGLFVPFATDMPVARQRLAILQMRRWAQSNHFQPGSWFFGGQAQ